MAGVSSAAAPPDAIGAREQFAAIGQLRWRIFVNSLRTLRGRLEAVSWVLMGLLFAGLGIGGTAGLATVSYFVTRRQHVGWIALPLWVLFLYWQLFPVMATAFTENFDLSNFLRFPIRYRSYFFIRMAYGALDPTTVIGTLWLAGIAVGIGAGEPGLFAWAALLAITFGALNILLARAIFAWIERWLARRKSREILGLVFFLFIIAFQFVGPVLGRYGNRARHAGAELTAVAGHLLQAERFTPPGLFGRALSAAAQGSYGAALGSWALECGYSAILFWVLDVRLRAQYRGENLSEGAARAAAAPKAKVKTKATVREGIALPGFSGPVAAVFEKDVRSFLRSGPMLFMLVMPIVITILFSLGPSAARQAGHHGGPNFGGFVFPVGVAYAVLLMSNLTYNSFGMVGGGIQFYFVAPVRFRQIFLAKNLTHGALLALETILVWGAVCLMGQPPPLGLTLATLSGLLFAAFLNFCVGDLLSLYSPRKVDVSAFGRQRSTGISALAATGVQVVVFGICAMTFIFARLAGRMWVAAPILLALAAAAFVGYRILLDHIDRIAISRREALITELCRAQ
ncbi:MAG TPA: hypothetical protein VMB02_16385 [Candidatus Aquilonibacter sp.]|nr:hypothetical protein [Candidatus Aquilonibacter sp.]